MKQTKLETLLFYGANTLILFIIVNFIVSYSIHYYTVAASCMTKNQVASDNRCLYVWGNQIYEKGSRSNDHMGHPCGTDVTQIIPASHVGNQARYLLPNYIANVCPNVPAPTATPIPRPTNTPIPQPTDTPIPRPTNTPVPNPTDTPVPQPTDTPIPNAPTSTPVPTNTPVSPTATPMPNTPTTTPVPTNTPMSQVSTAPTPTNVPVPVVTSIPEQTVIEPIPGSVVLSVSFSVTGISDVETVHLMHPSRNMTFFVYQPGVNGLDPNVKPLFVTTDQISFDATLTDTAYKLFRNQKVVIPSLPAGTYTIWVKETSSPLQELVDGKGNSQFNLTPGIVLSIPKFHLLTGDIDPFPNSNNRIDGNDYVAFTNCFGSKVTTNSCPIGYGADFDDDGVINGDDYNIFVLDYSQYRKLNNIPLPTPTPVLVFPTLVAVRPPTSASVSSIPAVPLTLPPSVSSSSASSTAQIVPSPTLIPDQQAQSGVPQVSTNNGVWLTIVFDVMTFLFVLATMGISIVWGIKAKKAATAKKLAHTHHDKPKV